MDPNFPSEGANVGPPVRIPTGRRRLMLVAVVALVAGGVAAAAVIATRGGASAPATTAARPLSGRPPLVLQLPGPAARGNAAVYAAAQQRLPAGDVRLSVARAIMAYDPAHRARTVAALRRLPQDNPAVVFALGMAQLWAGDPKAAEQTLERVKQLDPYGYYGTNADNVLHIGNEAPGYPPYFAPPSTPHGSLRALRAAVAAHPASSAAWLALAARLEHTDRLAAVQAVRKAAALEPNGISEQVASAVLDFNKDRPMDSLQKLMTLTSQPGVQQNPEVRFHLGVLYFWLRDGQDAAAQFRQVVQDAPNSGYAQVAHVFETCIDDKAECTRIANSG